MLKRSIEIKVRMTSEEAAALTKMAKKCSHTREAYIRSILENRIPRETPPPDYHAMMQELFNISNDMRTVAETAASCGDIDAQKYDDAYVKIAYGILAIQEAVLLPVKGN